MPTTPGGQRQINQIAGIPVFFEENCRSVCENAGERLTQAANGRYALGGAAMAGADSTVNDVSRGTLWAGLGHLF